MKPNFNMEKHERVLVDRIVERASQAMPGLDRISLAMDLIATHNHVCRLRFDDLLEADDFNFAHDVTGIMVNLDREDLVLRNCFLPRFAAN